KDLQALDDLVARYARVRELLAGASSDEARASLETESADFERQIAVKRAKLKGYDGYVFGTEEVRARHDGLMTLVSGIGHLLDPTEGAAARLRSRKRTAQPEAPPPPVAESTTPDWAAAVRAVAAGAKYQKLRLKPEKDLAPLGADPQSGLQEFLHLATH